MTLRLIIALLLLPSLVFAGQGMGPGPGFKTYSAAGGEDVVYTIQGVSSGESIYNANNTTQWGQSWTIPSGGGGVLKAVTFRTTQTTPDGGISCRVGTANGQINMSSSYASGSGSFPSGSAGEFTITIINGPTVSVGDVFAVVCQADQSTYRGISYLSANPYSGWKKYATIARDWDLTGHQDSTHDFYFKYTVYQ